MANSCVGCCCKFIGHDNRLERFYQRHTLGVGELAGLSIAASPEIVCVPIGMVSRFSDFSCGSGVSEYNTLSRQGGR